MDTFSKIFEKRGIGRTATVPASQGVGFRPEPGWLPMAPLAVAAGAFIEGGLL